jgi:hypothetical protein
MKMKKLKQWFMPILIVGLVAAFIIFQVTSHQKLQASRLAFAEQFEASLKTAYLSLNDLRTAVETKDAQMSILFEMVLEDIHAMDTYVDAAKTALADRDKNTVRPLYSSFNTAQRYISNILEEGLTVDDTIISDGFLNDKTIDANELMFLETLSDQYGALHDVVAAYLSKEADYDQLLAALRTFNGNYADATLFSAIHSPADDALGVYDEIVKLTDTAAAARVDQYWGVIDTAGEWVLEPLYDKIEAGIDGDLIIESRSWWGILTSEGDEKLMLQCDGIAVSGDCYAISENGATGLYDPVHDIDYDPMYDLIYSISGDIILYATNDRYSFIHRGGMLSTDAYRSITQSGNYLIVQTFEGPFEILNFEGENVTGSNYDDVINLYDNHAIVLTSVGYMAITLADASSVGASDAYTDESLAGPPSGSLAVSPDQAPVPIDADKIVGTNTEENILYTKNGKTGILNAAGKIIIPAAYSYLVPFDGKALTPAVKDAYDKVTYINHDGEVVLETDYTYGNAFDRAGHAVISDGMDFGLINTEGETVVPCEYDAIHLISYGDDAYGYALERDGAMAVSDLIGNIQTEFNYDAVDADPELGCIIGYAGDVVVILSRDTYKPLITGSAEEIDALVYYKGQYGYREGSEWGIKTLDGKTVTLAIYDALLWLNDTSYAVRIDDKYYLYTLAQNN